MSGLRASLRRALCWFSLAGSVQALRLGWAPGRRRPRPRPRPVGPEAVRPPPGPARANPEPRPAPASRAANGRGSRFCPGETCKARRPGPQTLLALAVPSDGQAQAWPPQQPARWSSLGGKRPARARRAPLGACRVRGGVPGAQAGGGWCCGAGSLPADVAAGGRADSAGRAHGRFWGTGRLPASPGRRARHSMWATRSPPAKLYQPSWCCGQETRIKQSTRGHSLETIALGTAQHGGTPHAPDRAACGARERFLAPARRRGGSRCWASAPGMPNSWRIRLSRRGAWSPACWGVSMTGVSGWSSTPFFKTLAIFLSKKAFRRAWPLMGYDSNLSTG